MSIKLAARVMACLVMASLCSFSCAQTATGSGSDTSQQTQPQANPQSQKSAAASPSGPGTAPPGNGNKDEPNTGGQSETSGTSKDRLFYALPNFLTLENVGQVPPLTTKQKFGVVTRGSFDYVQFPWYGFLSLISQAEDSEPGYGQGAAGFGKRYGAAFADGTIENYMTGAVFPWLLRQDPRYFQSGKGSFMHRMIYSASRNLITRTDSGKSQFNYSEVFGGALAAAISTYSYHPKSKFVTTPSGGLRFIPSDRTLPNTAKVWGTQYGYDTLTLVVKEFWPDIRRKISHKHKPDDPAAVNPTPHP